MHGVVAKVEGKTTRIPAKAVILASGGFEANAEIRTRYLGPGWDLAKVRGTRFNTGAGIKMALDIGAMPYGNWSGCHAVGWDYNAAEFGDLAVGDNFQKHSYPFAIMVNADGVRCCDEAPISATTPTPNTAGWMQRRSGRGSVRAKKSGITRSMPIIAINCTF